MGDFRIVYGSALGRQNDLAVRSDGLITPGDTTPDVTLGTYFYTNNTSNTVITHFDLTGQGGVTNPLLFQGKQIKIVFLDDSTSLLNANQLILADSDATFSANSSIEFIYHNSAWIETNRSYARGVIRIESKNLVAVGANTGGFSARGVSVVNCIATAGSPLVVRKAIGGRQGQILTLVAAGGSDILVVVNSAAADCFVSTSTATGTQFRMAASGAVSFVRVGATWKELTPIWANSSVTYST